MFESLSKSLGQWLFAENCVDAVQTPKSESLKMIQKIHGAESSCRARSAPQMKYHWLPSIVFVFSYNFVSFWQFNIVYFRDCQRICQSGASMFWKWWEFVLREFFSTLWTYFAPNSTFLHRFHKVCPTLSSVSSEGFSKSAGKSRLWRIQQKANENTADWSRSRHDYSRWNAKYFWILGEIFVI